MEGTLHPSLSLMLIITIDMQQLNVTINLAIQTRI